MYPDEQTQGASLGCLGFGHDAKVPHVGQHLIGNGLGHHGMPASYANAKMASGIRQLVTMPELKDSCGSP